MRHLAFVPGAREAFGAAVNTILRYNGRFQRAKSKAAAGFHALAAGPEQPLSHSFPKRHIYSRFFTTELSIHAIVTLSDKFQHLLLQTQ